MRGRRDEKKSVRKKLDDVVSERIPKIEKIRFPNLTQPLSTVDIFVPPKAKAMIISLHISKLKSTISICKV